MAVGGYTMRDHLKASKTQTRLRTTIDRQYDPAAATVDQINLDNHRPKR
jgi:hypothetical protein